MPMLLLTPLTIFLFELHLMIITHFLSVPSSVMSLPEHQRGGNGLISRIISYCQYYTVSLFCLIDFINYFFFNSIILVFVKGTFFSKRRLFCRLRSISISNALPPGWILLLTRNHAHPKFKKKKKTVLIFDSVIGDGQTRRTRHKSFQYETSYFVTYLCCCNRWMCLSPKMVSLNSLIQPQILAVTLCW